MLVKESIVQTWYQKDSWVYKNFSFLFLWMFAKAKKKGACPYFQFTETNPAQNTQKSS